MRQRAARLASVTMALSLPAQAQQETLLAEVSVAAEADSTDVRRHGPTARIVFNREELEALDAASVAELLKKLPGTGLFADLESKQGRKRGADRNLPRILVDGEALPGGDRSPGAALRLPVDLIERVEIIRNSSAEFPAAGPGGTINLVLRDVPTKASRALRLGMGAVESGSGGEPSARAEGQYGNPGEGFGYLWSGALARRPNSGSNASDIREFTAGAPTTWRLEQEATDGREDSATFSPRFTWDLGGGQRFVLTPMLMLADDRRFSNTLRRDYADLLNGAGLAYAGRVQQQDRGDRASGRLSGEWRANHLPWGELSARLSVQAEQETQDKARREYDVADLPIATLDEEETRTDREIGLTLKTLAPLGGAHLLGAGLEWRNKRVSEAKDSVGDGVPSPVGAESAGRQTEARLALWGQDEWHWAEGHLLTAGLRWQANELKSTDGLGITQARAHTALEPSLHYLWQAGPAWNWRASLAANERAPGLRDLSSLVRLTSGDNSSGNPDKAGNPALKPERTLGFEGGVEYFIDAKRGHLGVNAFLRRVEDQVQKLTLLEGARWVERPYNVGQARVTGAVLDFKLRRNALTLRGNLSHSRTRLHDAPASLGVGEGPRSAANLGFDYELRQQRLTLGGNLNHSSALTRENTPDLRQTQGARTQLDLYAVQKLDKQFSLRLSLQNATGAGKSDDLAESSAGSPSRLEMDRETGVRSLFLALEGKW